MTYGNLPSIENTNNTTDFFNNFFKQQGQQGSVSSNVNNLIISYFQTVTGSKDTGIALAASVLTTAYSQGVDPVELIDEFKKLKPRELNAYLTMFLNLNRVGTSLLGLTNSPQTSKYITRAVLA
jgi:hypothetical protein